MCIKWIYQCLWRRSYFSFTKNRGLSLCINYFINAIFNERQFLGLIIFLLNLLECLKLLFTALSLSRKNAHINYTFILQWFRNFTSLSFDHRFPTFNFTFLEIQIGFHIFIMFFLGFSFKTCFNTLSLDSLSRPTVITFNATWESLARFNT